MKIIVFSDSHGNSRNMIDIMNRHRTADCFFHLGDGNSEFENLRSLYPNTAFYSVLGNCDQLGSYLASDRRPPDTVIELEGFRFFLTHGHRYNVKSGLSELIIHAREKEADIVLFGHTHQKYYEYINIEGKNSLYLFNPGSISRPNEGLPSFGVIEIKKGSILFSNADYKF